jgi:hypothetical protein
MSIHNDGKSLFFKNIEHLKAHRETKPTETSQKIETYRNRLARGFTKNQKLIWKTTLINRYPIIIYSKSFYAQTKTLSRKQERVRQPRRKPAGPPRVSQKTSLSRRDRLLLSLPHHHILRGSLTSTTPCQTRAEASDLEATDVALLTAPVLPRRQQTPDPLEIYLLERQLSLQTIPNVHQRYSLNQDTKIVSPNFTKTVMPPQSMTQKFRCTLGQKKSAGLFRPAPTFLTNSRPHPV